MRFLHELWDTIRPHISSIVLAATWVGIAFVAIRRRRDWKSKRFANQVNFSLNYLIDGKLANRSMSGSWNHGAMKGDFKLTKK